MILLPNNLNQGKKNPREDEELIKFAKNTLSEMFDQEIAHKMNPLFLKNRTLTISCANQEIAQHVRENQENIVKQINLKLGKNEVDRIRYLL